MARDYRPILPGGASSIRRLAAALALLVPVPSPARSIAQDIEAEPIRYSSATPKNAVSRLEERLAAGEAKLEYEPEHGYLKSLLRALDVPESSQVLVFSRTSLQRERISPKTPRAIYFNDEVMVGFCLRGRVIEISAADEEVGTAFYTLGQADEERPAPERQTESCLLCHGSSVNQGIPGHLVRSVFADRRGDPILANGSYRTDHASPFAERWGGWYVTGTSGGQMHLGNMVCEGSDRPEAGENRQGVNVTDLKDRFTASFYPTPHSDIVALMVLEHQVGMLNRLARASIETRLALRYDAEMKKALGMAEHERLDSTNSRIYGVCEAVVRYMLFQDETRLTDRVTGTSTFAADFAARGRRDSKGRSLRDFDLQTRLFRHPCSYLIESRAFDALPAEAKDVIYRRLWDVLQDKASWKDAPKLAAEDREAVLAILRETRRDLPDYWEAPAAAR